MTIWNTYFECTPTTLFSGIIGENGLQEPHDLLRELLAVLRILHEIVELEVRSLDEVVRAASLEYPGTADSRVRLAAGVDVPDELGPVEIVDASSWRSACDGLQLSHMGRGPDAEPWFFAAAFAAGTLARSLVL